MSESMLNPDLRRKLKVKRRADLIFNKQRYGGQSYHVVKDPVSLKYFRFREEEMFLLKQFDGHNNFDDVRHEFVERFRPQRLSVVELEKFVQQLLQAGIATVDTPQLGQRLFERMRKKKRDGFKKAFLNILYLKIPIFDPERILQALLPFTAWIFSWWFFMAALTFGVVTLGHVLVNWAEFQAALPDYHNFFTWRNILYFWLTLAVVKIIHEFGHGISCKVFGGEVHEMGVLFLVLTPCLYCNVSDAWMLPNKWHRVVIGAAGMYVEVVMSCMFFWIWWYTEPGLLNTLSLSIVFICSVSTVLFNANPLLRFDGYYILSDLIEIPNLRERSNKYLGNLASRFFLGTEFNQDPYMPKQRKWFFAFYAVLAYVYRYVITFSILYFMYTFLKPYKLGSISAMLAVLALIPLLVFPVFKTGKAVKQRWRKLRVNKARFAAATGLAVALLLMLALIPFPMRIDVPMVVQPHEPTTVFVRQPGMLGEVFVEDGDVVAAGELLGELADPELVKQRRQQEQTFTSFRGSEHSFRVMNDPEQERIARLQAKLARQDLESYRKREEQMKLRTPVAGTVMNPPKQEAVGQAFRPGDVYCLVGDPNDLEAFLVVEHSDMALIRKDQRVWLKLEGHVGDIIEGRIAEIAQNQLRDVPQSLSNKAGGEIQTDTDADTNREIPTFRSYSLRVPLDGHDARLHAGVRGTARVDIGWHSLYWRVKRFLQQTFHFRT